MSTIKTIRTRLGLTQAELAAGIGCTQGNVGHYENKGQTIPPDVAKRLIALAAQHGQALTYEEIYGPAIATSQPPLGLSAAQETSHV